MTGPSGLDLIVEVAHDLRSPLTSILFLAETMLHGRSGPLTPLQERQLGLVYSAAFGLNAVASDVIELVRGGDRLVGRDEQAFSMAEVLEAVRDIVLPIAEEKGLELRFEGPPSDHRRGHPGALNRVLLNLTTNALKFTAEGYVEVKVVEIGGDIVECSVRDTGRGVPAAAMPTLFEPFRRRQKPGDYAFSGSGLGLSICRKLVEAMGAELSVSTVQGEGTEAPFSWWRSSPRGGFGMVWGGEKIFAPPRRPRGEGRGGLARPADGKPGQAAERSVGGKDLRTTRLLFFFLAAVSPFCGLRGGGRDRGRPRQWYRREIAFCSSGRPAAGRRAQSSHAQRRAHPSRAERGPPHRLRQRHPRHPVGPGQGTSHAAQQRHHQGQGGGPAAYADWRRYPQYIVPLSESSIDLIFAPAFGTNKKNATDIRLAVDAIELVFTRPEIGTFILLSGDSDFSSLVIKLKEYGKYVIGVGIRESASDLPDPELRRVLLLQRPGRAQQGSGRPRSAARSGILIRKSCRMKREKRGPTP